MPQLTERLGRALTTRETVGVGPGDDQVVHELQKLVVLGSGPALDVADHRDPRCSRDSGCPQDAGGSHVVDEQHLRSPDHVLGRPIRRRTQGALGLHQDRPRVVAHVHDDRGVNRSRIGTLGNQ